MKISRILMVCLGNICRSPLAEGILRAKLPSIYTIESAGTGAYHIGEKPDERSIITAKKHGIDIYNHKSRLFTKEDFRNFDIIYVMDIYNYREVLAKTKNEEDKRKVRLILNELNKNNTSVPDPYYGDLKDFEYIYELLNKACSVIAKHLIEINKQ